VHIKSLHIIIIIIIAFEVKRVTPSVAASGDIDLSDATGNHFSSEAMASKI